MTCRGKDTAIRCPSPASLGGSRFRLLEHGGVAGHQDGRHRQPARAVVPGAVGVLRLRAPGHPAADADGNRGNYAILLERLQEVIEKRPKGHGYITRGLYNWGWICPLTGDIHLAFDRPIPATETAGAPAASAAATAALEAVFARCVSAQMFTPPPDFRRQPVAGPLSFASNHLASAASPHARSTRRFRTAHPAPLGSGQGSGRPTSTVRRLSYQPSPPTTLH